MFGRVRAAPCWVEDDSLELERRTPSKIIKDDSHSIYEITLQKLRLGSRRALNSPPAEEMKIDAPCSSSSESTTSPSSSSIESISISKQPIEDSSSCRSLCDSKCKKGPWTHYYNVASANLETQVLGQKV